MFLFIYASGSMLNANLRRVLVQHQPRQSDSSQQGSGKVHCLPFDIEGNDSARIHFMSELVNIMQCGLCDVLTFSTILTFCAIIWGYKLSQRNNFLFCHLLHRPFKCQSGSVQEIVGNDSMCIKPEKELHWTLSCVVQHHFICSFKIACLNVHVFNSSPMIINAMD